MADKMDFTQNSNLLKNAEIKNISNFPFVKYNIIKDFAAFGSIVYIFHPKKEKQA